MLSVANLTTWTNYFKQSAIKNCNVCIYNSAGSLLIDKTQIGKFSLTMRNCFVCKEIPNDVCSIQVLHWNNLSSAIKTYLTTKGNCVKVAYVVESVETTTCKVLAVSRTKINRQGTVADIELINPLELKTEINQYIYGGYTYPDGFRYGANAVSGAYPLNSTTAECIQLYTLDKSVSVLKGYRIATISKSTPFTLSSYNPYDVSNFKDYDKNAVDDYIVELNIHDYELYFDEEGNDSIEVYGATLDDNYQTEVSPHINNPLVDSEWNCYLPEEGYITKTECFTEYGDPYDYFFAHLYNNKVRFYLTSDPQSPFIWYVLTYKKLNLVEIANGVSNYIQSKAFLQSNVSGIQTNIRGYYANKDMVNVECRMNPIYEPLDIIGVALEGDIIKYIVLEEVTINFNGGFTGSIKGRIVGELTSLTAPTIQFNINNQDFVNSVNNSYNFVVTNSNPVAVVLTLEDESSYIIKQISIPANTTVTLYSTTDLNNDLDEYVRTRINEVYGYFEYEEMQSSSVVVLETRDIIPPTVTSSVYGNTFNIAITNNNLYGVDLKIDYSGGTLEGYISPYSTINVNQQDYPELIDSAEAYDDTDLHNAVTCYYEVSEEGLISDTTIIWEANGE